MSTHTIPTIPKTNRLSLSLAKCSKTLTAQAGTYDNCKLHCAIKGTRSPARINEIIMPSVE